MEFIQTERNSRNLLYHGHLYVKNKTLNNGNTFWECEQRRSGNGCSVKVLLDPGDNFIRISGDHTHAPNPERAEDLNIRTQIRREARLLPDRRTNNIVAGNLVLAERAVIANLPELETMRRDVRRNQQHVRDAPPIPDRYNYR